MRWTTIVARVRGRIRGARVVYARGSPSCVSWYWRPYVPARPVARGEVFPTRNEHAEHGRYGCSNWNHSLVCIIDATSSTSLLRFEHHAKPPSSRSFTQQRLRLVRPGGHCRKRVPNHFWLWLGALRRTRDIPRQATTSHQGAEKPVLPGATVHPSSISWFFGSSQNPSIVHA